MHLFLSYNRSDEADVRFVREALHARNVSTFVDWNDLSAGLPWPAKLERALRDARAVAVFVGPSGLGPWQMREMYYALDLQVQRGSLPVIPVLLAGAEPPTGFLALNTWVDLRGGVSEESLAPLLRAIDGSVVARPALDVCPYRDLRAFREEDAALFFGRDEAVAQLVQRVESTSHALGDPALVAVVGPSGSGKSSVVMAGVLPALRRQRPPDVVWDSVTFTPGDAPWRRLADALLPPLDPGLSEAQRIGEAATLAEALRTENGIGSTIARILQKSGGTDRLLVVVDQFEELFTLTEEKVAREFVRALLAASRSVPMTVLLTLRSDYYGKAIAIDRDLSNALPAAQVNLGPIRPDELRDVIEKPAFLVGLSFEPGLVERILDDVEEEPGNLPLLEYALTELWKARSGDRLTFDAYERIGRVSGALANRANELYRELSDTQRAAARRLLLRLVRVTAADEEGADTRRRARRDEIDDEAWKLVPFFTSSRARLLVAGTDPTSNQDTVEVAHEALIRKWDTLRAWLDEDRRFLLWRQQLTVFRAKWIESGDAADEGTLLRGTLLDEAQKWLRARRTELSAGERRYVEASAKQVVRSRAVWIAAAALVLLALVGVGAWAAYQRTTGAVLKRIFARNPERYLMTVLRGNTADLTTFVRLNRISQIEAEIQRLPARARPRYHAQLAMAIGAAHPGVDVTQHIRRAEEQTRGRGGKEDVNQLLDVAEVLLRHRHKSDGIRILSRAEMLPGAQHLRLAYLWGRAGYPARARASLHRQPVGEPGVIDEMGVELLSSYAAQYAESGDPANALAFVGRVLRVSPGAWPADRGTILRNLAIVEARLRLPLLSQLRSIVPADELANVRSIVEALNQTPAAERLLTEWLRETNADEKRAKTFVLVRMLAYSRRFDALRVIADDPALHAVQLRTIVDESLAAGEVDVAAHAAERMRKLPEAGKVFIAEPHARLAAALARVGRRKEAKAAYDLASAVVSAPDVAADEGTRDKLRAELSGALAALERDYEALRLAESIEDDDSQWDALFAILREIAFREPRPHAGLASAMHTIHAMDTRWTQS